MSKYSYDRQSTSQDGLYHDAKKTYQKLTEVMSDLDFGELAPHQKEELKRMHGSLDGWIKKL